MQTIEDIYEPYLIQKGFLERTPRGRRVTGSAYAYLGKPVPGGREGLLLPFGGEDGEA